MQMHRVSSAVRVEPLLNAHGRVGTRIYRHIKLLLLLLYAAHRGPSHHTILSLYLLEYDSIDAINSGAGPKSH